MIKDMCRNFTETELKPVAAINDKNHTYPAEQVKKLGELGMMGVSVSVDYGGSGESFQKIENFTDREHRLRCMNWQHALTGKPNC